MKKSSVLQIISCLLVVIIFNVFFFVAGGVEHKVSVWISYGFIHFAYIMLCVSQLLVRKVKSRAVLGYPLNSISLFYFIIEFIACVVFFIFSPDSYIGALLTQLAIAALYAIILLSNLVANERTADAEEKRHYEIMYVKDASARLKRAAENIGDKEAKKRVERLYDTVYSSPVKSHPSLEQIETNILQSINELEDAVSDGDKERIMSLANSLASAVNERNTRLRNTHNA